MTAVLPTGGHGLVQARVLRQLLGHQREHRGPVRRATRYDTSCLGIGLLQLVGCAHLHEAHGAARTARCCRPSRRRRPSAVSPSNSSALNDRSPSVGQAGAQALHHGVALERVLAHDEVDGEERCFLFLVSRHAPHSTAATRPRCPARWICTKHPPPRRYAICVRPRVGQLPQRLVGRVPVAVARARAHQRDARGERGRELRRRARSSSRDGPPCSTSTRPTRPCSSMAASCSCSASPARSAVQSAAPSPSASARASRHRLSALPPSSAKRAGHTASRSKAPTCSRSPCASPWTALLPHERRRVAAQARAGLAGAGERIGRHEHAVDLHHALERGERAHVVVVAVGHHHGVQAEHGVAREALAQEALLVAGVHEHGRPLAADDERVALAHVEHDDLVAREPRGDEHDREGGRRRGPCDQRGRARARRGPERPERSGQDGRAGKRGHDGQVDGHARAGHATRRRGRRRKAPRTRARRLPAGAIRRPARPGPRQRRRALRRRRAGRGAPPARSPTGRRAAPARTAAADSGCGEHARGGRERKRLARRSAAGAAPARPIQAAARPANSTMPSVESTESANDAESAARGRARQRRRRCTGATAFRLDGRRRARNDVRARERHERRANGRYRHGRQHEVAREQRRLHAHGHGARRSQRPEARRRRTRTP